MEDILINVLTRTHNRPNLFKHCRDSVINQTYKNINHIVGSDGECNYHDGYIPLVLQKAVYPKPDRLASYEAPWNLHLNELAKQVKDGWIIYLDDDDKFVSLDAVQNIVNNIVDEDEVIFWRVDINGTLYPSDANFGKILPGHISGIGFMFHSKHLPLTHWYSWNFGDYRVMIQLTQKLKQRWLNSILTQTQGRANHGTTPINA